MIDKIFTRVKAEAGEAGEVGAAGAKGSAAEERKQIAVLARQFESMLISQMLREMKDSMTPEEDERGFGAEILGDTVNTELSASLSNSGGLGLAESLMKSLEKLEPQSVQQNELEMDPTPDPRSLIPDPFVTSAFGWRPDPLNGHQKFHKGTDIRAAYGEAVRAAAGGVVTFAGEQPGYGLVVKVDHGNGLETRYAHLSSVAVQAGMEIQAGSPIAQSGNSGRTTGPHLHFEVRQDGQPIDPERVTGFVPVTGTGVSAAR